MFVWFRFVACGSVFWTWSTAGKTNISLPRSVCSMTTIKRWKMFLSTQVRKFNLRCFWNSGTFGWSHCCKRREKQTYTHENTYEFRTSVCRSLTSYPVWSRSPKKVMALSKELECPVCARLKRLTPARPTNPSRSRKLGQLVSVEFRHHEINKRFVQVFI